MIPFLDNRVEPIIDLWVAQESTLEIFRSLDIDPSHFKTTFGSPVLQYFIDVIKGVKSIGDCPVMRQFINFMEAKGITSKEVFTICMGLRRSLITYLLRQHKIDAHIEQALDEISDIFDANLSGVLQVFANLRHEKEKELEHQLSLNRQQKYVQAILNAQTNLLCVIKEGKIVIANHTFLHTVGASDLKAFQASNKERWIFMYNVNFHAALFEKGDYQQWIEKVARNRREIIKVSLKNEYTGKLATYILQASQLYSGKPEHILTLTDISTYEKAFEQLTTQLYIDPVTKFYNHLKFDSLLREEHKDAREHKRSFSLITLDIDDYLHLAKKYDSLTMDSIILGVSRYLIEQESFNCIKAHVQDARFHLLCKNRDTEALFSYAKSLQQGIAKIDFGLPDEVTAAVSFVTLREEDTIDTLIQRVEQLMAEISELGGNICKDDELLYQKQKAAAMDQTHIIDHLVETVNHQGTITAIGIYKGIPITSEVTAVAINTIKRQARFHVKNSKLLLAFSKKIVVEIDGYERYISSQVIRTDLSRGEFTLGVFRFVEAALMDRKNVRVEPVSPLPVTITHKKIRLTGNLYDISANSFAIDVSDPGGLKSAIPVHVQFSLETADSIYEIQSNGHLSKIEKLPECYRIVITLYLDTDHEEQIQEYIAWRQLQIIKELKSIASESNKTKSC